jgi:hypothetical protein
MYRRAGVLFFASLLLVSGASAFAQGLSRPAEAPIITAENESWYVDREPIIFAGNLYYPAGAQVFFNPNEMVRSGFYLGIPLYTRTTIEPYSVVFVPVAGGRMQPYERPRTGELTGTAGSTPRSVLTPYNPASAATLLPQAPAPPVNAPVVIVPDAAPPAAPAESAVGTAGREPYQPAHTRIGGRPTGLNAIFVEFQGRRWYSSGHNTEIDPALMERIGEYRGFDVWRPKNAAQGRIVISTTRGGSIGVPYSTKPPAYEGLRSK